MRLEGWREAEFKVNFAAIRHTVMELRNMSAKALYGIYRNEALYASKPFMLSLDMAVSCVLPRETPSLSLPINFDRLLWHLGGAQKGALIQ